MGRISKGFRVKLDLPWVSEGPKARSKDVADGQQLRFLYCDMTELWGHVWRATTGMESRGQR